MEELSEYRLKLLERLERQPGELDALIGSLPEAQWRHLHVGDGRVVHLVVAHVRDLEGLAFLPRLRRVLFEPRPSLEPFPTHRWSEDNYRPDESLADILADFARARAQAVSLLRPLTSEDWCRQGFHSPSGWRTSQWWAERMFTHPQNHLIEINRALGRLKTRPIQPLGRHYPPVPPKDDLLT